MNNPYPSQSQLRIERRTEGLLAEHAAAVKTFQEAMTTALSAFRQLDFPLGSPADEYDLEDIDRLLTSWSQSAPSDDFTEANARDLAEQREDP